MKRVSLFFMTVMLCLGMMAVPAHRGTVRVKQPDGSYVTLRLHGDEWRHYQTTTDGYTVVKDHRGFFVYAEKDAGELKATAQVAHDLTERDDKEQVFLKGIEKNQAPAMSDHATTMCHQIQQIQRQKLASRRAQGARASQYDYSKFKGLIVLVEYKDKSFSREDYKDIVNNMVNKEGYSGFDDLKLTGSVRDYFSDNSYGSFQPEFDVVGPYKVNYSQYSPRGVDNVDPIIIAAIDAADEDVDFSEYDGDGDGMVDLIYFIVAGNGANYSGNDSRLWWPHRYVVYQPSSGSYGMEKDGVTLYDYASSTELMGYTSYPQTVRIDGIGTIVHEFSHVLGLPDFYDADYEENGQSNDPGDWSVMAGGCYADNGDTPVGYSLYERYSVGFMDEPQTIDKEGSYALNSLPTSGEGYRINSAVSDEFFLFENRQQADFVWDSYLPGSGLLVHRVEKPGSSVWENNTVNNYSGHNYYEVIRANGYNMNTPQYDVFPSQGKTTLDNSTKPANLLSYSGKNTKYGLYNIQMSDDGVITFDIANALNLKKLIVNNLVTIGVGMTIQLEAKTEPDGAECSLTWTSSDEEIATVDSQGLVTGVSAGQCVVTVMGDNGVSAECQVIVDTFDPVTVAEAKRLEQGREFVLQLTDAEVLYVNKKTAYLRDATGSVRLSNMDLGLKQNDRVSGTLFASVGLFNGMVQFEGVGSLTNASGLTITHGAKVEPREVKLEDLTEDDYGDYVVLKAVQLERNAEGYKGVWAVSGDTRVRLYNMFQLRIVTLPTEVRDKYYDIYALYGTDSFNGQDINEFYMLKSPKEVDAPQPEDPETPEDPDNPGGTDAIRTIGSTSVNNGNYYSLQGQRVDGKRKGIFIYKGRKVVVQ